MSFPPHHLVHYANVALDDFHHLGGDIFIRVVRNRGAVVAVLDKFYCSVDGLEKSFGVDAGENKETRDVRSRYGCKLPEKDVLRW